MELGEIMTTGVEVISADESVMEAAIKMKQLDVGLIPVCDGDKLRGVVTDRDIVVRATAKGRDPAHTKVSDVMSADVVYCFEDQEVEEGVSLMAVRQIRRLPILNQAKSLVGIVSLGDIAIDVRNRELSGETLEEVSEPAVPRK
jgi:CBS domain-containing protein